MSRYTFEVRTTKEPFLLSTYNGIVQEAAADIKSQTKDILGVEVLLRNIRQALGAAMPAAMEQESLIKGEQLIKPLSK